MAIRNPDDLIAALAPGARLMGFGSAVLGGATSTASDAAY